MRGRMTRGANTGSSTGRVALSSRASPSRTAAECEAPAGEIELQPLFGPAALWTWTGPPHEHSD